MDVTMGFNYIETAVNNVIFTYAPTHGDENFSLIIVFIFTLKVI